MSLIGLSINGIGTISMAFGTCSFHGDRSTDGGPRWRSATR